MGIVLDFFNDLKSYLSITTQFSGYAGSGLNVGETFTMTVKIANTAPSTGPFIVFNIGDCWVHKTDYAVPLDANGNEVDSIQVPLDHHELVPYDWPEIESEVRMKAKAASSASGMGGMPYSEAVAKIQVAAQWIPDKAFTIEKTARKNILPT